MKFKDYLLCLLLLFSFACEREYIAHSDSETPDPAFSLDPVPLGPQAAYRGIYIDVLKNPDYPNDPNFNILGNVPAENAMLNWVVNHDFNAVTLYDIGTILNPNSSSFNSNRTKLRNFIQRAHVQYGLEVTFAYGGANSLARGTAYWTSTVNPATRKQDGMVSEYEFWNPNAGADFATFQTLVTSLNAFLSAASQQPPFTRLTSSFYVGRLRDAANTGGSEMMIADYLINNCDRIFLTDYHADFWDLNPTPYQTRFRYMVEVLGEATFIRNTNVPHSDPQTDIVVLFNVKPNDVNEPDNGNIRDWFSDPSRCRNFGDAYREFANSYNALNLTRNTAIPYSGHINIIGYQYYKYSSAVGLLQPCAEQNPH